MSYKIHYYCSMKRILYKYLDAIGGSMMLENTNLQFTNADDLNDPFDCHPSLIDKSLIKYNNYPKDRYNTMVCSLSKVNNSILMWSYYGNHSGVCIGIDIDKVKQNLQGHIQLLNVELLELQVQYKNIIEKPDIFRDYREMIIYQLSTKADEWKHEQEVRLVLSDPISSSTSVPLRKDEIYVNHSISRIVIGGECFESLYLGINIDKTDKCKITKIAQHINPQMKIYQMKPDADEFKIKAELLLQDSK